MKYIRKGQAVTFKVSEVCTAYEYPLGDKGINGAVIRLNGRYPDSGRVMNEVCKELVYIINGSGKVVVEGAEMPLDNRGYAADSAW